MTPSRRYVEQSPEGPRLGVDLDDFVARGEPVAVRARIEGAPAEDHIRVWMTALPVGVSAGPVRCKFTRLNGDWVLEWLPPRDGLWRVSVQAIGVRDDQGKDVPVLDVEDTVAVLDCYYPS